MTDLHWAQRPADFVDACRHWALERIAKPRGLISEAGGQGLRAVLRREHAFGVVDSGFDLDRSVSDAEAFMEFMGDPVQ
jgi:hypothetical protein